MASKKHKTNKQTKEKTVCGSDQQAQGVGLCLLDILVQGRSRDDSTFRELQDGFRGTSAGHYILLVFNTDKLGSYWS